MECRLLLLMLAVVVASPATEKAPVAAEEDDVAMALRYTAECKTELKLSDADVAAVQKKLPLTQKTKCLIKCVAQKFELIVGGKIVEKEVMEWVEEERAENKTLADLELQMYNSCKNSITAGSDECDKAARVFMCARDFTEKNRLVF